MSALPAPSLPAPSRSEDCVDVSVLVPVLNEERHIREMVAAMQAQRFDGTIELLFADGGSEDRTREILLELAASDPRVRVLDNPRRRTASGLNVCLREARGTHVARMDAHTLYPPRYLQDGVDRLRRGDVAWVAGPQVPQARGRVSAAVVAALATRLGRGASRRWSGGEGAGAEYELDTGVFCGVWCRADVLAHGGWDEGWPRNQDSELAARFLGAGQRIVCVPAMAAHYIPRDSIAALWRQYRGYGSYRAKTARRHPASLRRSAVLPPLLVIDGLAALAGPRLLRRTARMGLWAYGAALLAAAAATMRRRRGAASLVPVVLATMHIAHGIGFLEGACRWGVPWRALWRIARGGGDVTPYRGSIQAPSLHAGYERPEDLRAMRLGVYTDYTYKQDAHGVSGERAFVCFMTALRPLVDTLVLVGRLDARPGRSHYPLETEVEFVGLPYYASLTRPIDVLRSLAGSMRRFWRLLDDVDTVWLLGPYAHAIGFVFLALLRRRRVVLGVRQDLPRYVRSRHPGARWMHLSADVLEGTFRVLARRLPVVVVGPDLARRYARSPRLLELTVSLVAAADISSEPEALSHAQNGVRHLLSVGRLDREKNPLLLADIMAALLEDDPAWRLVVVGDGPLRGELQARVEQLGLADAVQLRGYVPIDGELPQLYRSADAFLHVSWTEGVPQVLFEAFAAGLPVVATDVGGVARAAGDAALLVTPGDATAAARAIRRVADEAPLRQRLVQEGLERVREHTLEAETQRLVAFLEHN